MRLSRLLALCVTLMTLAAPALAQTTHIAAQLVAESSAPAAGSDVTLALDMRPAPGWHGYWSNPGEAGFEPVFKWTLPPGVVAGAPAFPVPKTLTIAGLMNYVFEGEHALLFRVHVPGGLAKGAALPLRLSANWLACTDKICVPEHGDFALDLKVGDGAKDRAARFDAWRAALPAPLGADAHFARESDVLRIAIPYPAGAALADPHFFPLANGTIVDAAPQRFARDGDRLIATLSAPKDSNTAPIGGVLAIGGGRGLSLTATPGPAPEADAGGLAAILFAIGGALLGGLILNVMPCVFPILSLKALSLAQAGTDERAARREALAYAGGAIATCVALGATMLALKAGWAFQLQDARVVLLLLLLVVALALNLAGLFALPTLAGGVDARGGFLTGALAAFIATPCTGPFLGAALGAALVLPVAAAMGVFAGLGLGLALPFLFVGFVPAIRRRLPKPGAWMERLRRILAVPMALTALWLGWLLWRQAGSSGLALGIGAVAVA
ncbi:MAG: thiol:disulfide interchange protein, partial [Sphingomonadaceae bacterium]|nr:thiol:disulfide interchange protein [Sphingomonadaceae bacterium]